MNSRGSRRIRDAFTERFCTGPGPFACARFRPGCRPLSPAAARRRRMLGIGNNSATVGPGADGPPGLFFLSRSFMEQLLLKLARQLDAMDEASLMSLWDKYAQTVQRFEPSERWQEAVLVSAWFLHPGQALEKPAFQRPVGRPHPQRRRRRAGPGAAAPIGLHSGKSGRKPRRPPRGTPGQRCSTSIPRTSSD